VRAVCSLEVAVEQTDAYALVEVGDSEAIDVFLQREDADAFLAECLKDEPAWKDVLRVVPIELDERSVSAN
jgi:hypothetical protein